jgi:hypothetical protein
MPIKKPENQDNKRGAVISFGKQFKADMSISLSELYEEIEKAQAYVNQLKESLLVFGDSDGSPSQDSELSWDSVEKKLTSKHISCEDIVLDSGVTVNEFSTDDTLAGDSDSAVPTEQAVKGYVDTEVATAVLIDGTRELTADWDAGSYKITAEQLESDVATGTPPLIIASETLVDNLNADKWDGNEFGDYLDQDVKTTASPTFAGLSITPGNIVLDTGYIDSKAYYYINNTKFISAEGTNNMFLGDGAGASITSGNGNFFAGYQAGRLINTGITNLFLGYQAGFDETNGQRNIDIGYRAGYNHVGAIECTYIGGFTGYNKTGGNFNSAFGYGALRGAASNTGQQNLASGYGSLYNSQGSYNTSGGFRSGFNNISGNYNVFYGYKAGYYETGSNKLFIDNNDRTNEATGRVSSLVYGEFNTTVGSQLIRFNAGTFEINGGTDTDITCNFTGTTNSGVLKWMEDEDYFQIEDDIKINNGENIILDTTTGTKIGTSTSQKLGLFNATPVVQPTALTSTLTSITHTAPGTPDYAIQDLTNTSPYGFATKDEGNTVLSVILNLQTRVDELETKLQSLGAIA